MDNEKWLRRALHVAFLIVFAGVMYNSFSKLHAQSTAFTQEQKTAPTMLYPSITMCPVLSSDQYRNGNYTLGLKMEDLIKGFFHTYEEGNKTISIVENTSTFLQGIRYVERRNSFAKSEVKCITYDPPGPTKPGVFQGLVLHLSINTSDFWMITLHNRDTYLPGMHKVFGSTYIFTIPIMDNKTKRNQHGVFTLSSTKTHYMDLGGVKACEKTPTQTMEACIAGYVQTKVGCSYPWFNSVMQFPQCKSLRERELFHNVSWELNELGEQDIIRKTGCLPSCTRTQHIADPILHNVIGSPDKDPGLFTLQMYFPTNEYIEKTEYFLYGFPSLMADFGGYLGLLLGHSLLSLYDLMSELRKKISTC